MCNNYLTFYALFNVWNYCAMIVMNYNTQCLIQLKKIMTANGFYNLGYSFFFYHNNNKPK